jgi:low affinity Fe/Cu permease
MIFLIEYDRDAGELVEMRTFANDKRDIALKARLDREIMLRETKKRHEIVVLEAANEHHLRATHRRYFEDVASLATNRPRTGI